MEIVLLLDILWYHNLTLLTNSEKVFIETNAEEMRTTCTISNVSKSDVGYYICKAKNSVSEITTRAKLDLASATSASTKKTTTETIQTAQQISTNVSTVVNETATSTIKESSTQIKSEKKVKSHKKLSQTQKTMKQENKENEMNVTTVQLQKNVDAKEDVEIFAVAKSIIEPVAELGIMRRNEQIADTSKFEIVTKNQHFEDHDVEILEETEEIHVKVYKEVFSAEEMENFKIADEVNAILDSIEAHQFGSGERPLRELATIGHLLKKGVAISEIIQLYDEDIFTALKLPESQAALVQLVERQGYENLITEILNASSSEDEKLLASTVGFRAFIRLIEVTKIPVEEIIRNFKFEDFVSQEWKYKEIKDNEFVEVTESHVSSIRAEKVTVIGNEFE